MDAQVQTMVNNMPEKMGKSLEAWISILAEKILAKHGEAVKFLKSEHGVSHGFANTIVHLSKQQPEGEVDLVAKQYEGKEVLKPIFDSLKSMISAFGSDVEFAPKKTYVSVRRKKQFAIILPSTKTRLDLGLNLKGKEPEGALEASGSWNAMCTHRVRLSEKSDITTEIIAWLEEAYRQTR